MKASWAFWFAAALIAMYAFAVLFYPTLPHFPPSPYPVSPPANPTLPSGPTEKANWSFPLPSVLEAASSLTVNVNNLTGYGPFVPVFREDPLGIPMKEAMVEVLGLSADQISPAAFWSASNLAGYVDATYDGRNATYYVSPFPLDPANLSIAGYNLSLTFYGFSARPFHYKYPPSANISLTDEKLNEMISVSEYVVTEEQTGNTVVFYYAGTVSLNVPINIYNGSDPCLFVSKNGGGVQKVGCGGSVIDSMQVSANTYAGVFGSETDSGVVNDSITWNGTLIRREWVMGSWTLSSEPNITLGSGPCLEQPNETCTYEYYQIAGSFTSSVSQPPKWVFHHAPESLVYANNYAEGYIDGPAYYYGVARSLSSYIREKGGGDYSPWEAVVLMGEVGLSMNVTNANLSYEQALLSKKGNQSVVAAQQLLVSQYLFPTNWTKGFFANKTHLFGFFVPSPYPASVVEGEPNLSLSSGGFAVMLDATNNESLPFGVWWGFYRPAPYDGEVLTFREYAFPFPRVPFAFVGAVSQSRVTSLNRNAA